MTQKTQKSNTLWQGRIHLGDEPGLYGDAHYAGLCVELPVELIPFSAGDARNGEATIIVEATGFAPERGYSGNRVTVLALAETAAGWGKRSAIAEGHLDAANGGELHLTLTDTVPRRVIVRVEVDLAVEPGLYLETVIRRLSLASATHFGYLGYRFSESRLPAGAV